MRDQGRLVEWFDDKGYGFIQPNDPSKAKVFLHIKDFARPGPRPIVGCALEYLVILDGQGRCRAQQASYLTAAQARHLQGKTQAVPEKVEKLQPMQIMITAYLLSLGILSLSGHLAGLILLGILLANGISYLMYAQDKQAAREGKQRVPEQTLHVLSSLGGWPAAWLAQQKFRHKTQKQPFRQIYFATIVLHLMLLGWWLSPFNMFQN